MTTFTPPEGLGEARGDPHSLNPADRLFRHYSPLPTGETVWQDQDDTWHQSQYPYAGQVEDPGLLQAQRVYQGGHIHDISAADEAALITAGYGSRINIAPVKATWTSEQLSKFSSKMLLTADGTHATPAIPSLTNGNKLGIQLSAGTIPSQSSLREFFLHSDTAGWTDSQGVIEIDPPTFGLDIGGGALIIPQMGVVLRAQFNSSTGKNQGITLNNNVVFGIPFLNVGAWHAFPNGSGFANRQASPWDLTTMLGLPYGWKWELIGNTIRVKIFPAGTSPDAISWSDPVLSKTVDLNVDTGIVPMPTGPGTNGIISAHLGTDSRSMVRIRRFEMERIS
jgi:hypothetical protein